jgi:hypothetical protein
MVAGCPPYVFEMATGNRRPWEAGEKGAAKGSNHGPT